MIRLSNVSVRQGGQLSLKNVSLTIQKGEFAYVVGPSGAGKTTLLRTLYLDVPLASGHLIVEDVNSRHLAPTDVPFLRRRLGIVFQDFQLLDDRTVFDNVALVLRVFGRPWKEVRRRTLRALADVGLSHKSRAHPRQLSGGEKQRVGIARAVVNEPVILLADEPTGHLDSETALEIVRLIKKFTVRGTAALVATHNHRLAEAVPGRMFYLDRGELAEPGPSSTQ